MKNKNLKSKLFSTKNLVVSGSIVIIFLVAGGTVLLLSRKDSVDSRVQGTTTQPVSTELQNADVPIEEITTLLSTELDLEEDTLQSEDSEAFFDESLIDEYEEIANENDL